MRLVRKLTACALAGLIGVVQADGALANPIADASKICRTAHERSEQTSEALANAGWINVPVRDLDRSHLLAFQTSTIERAKLPRFSTGQPDVRYFVQGDDVLKVSHSGADDKSPSTAVVVLCDFVLHGAEAKAARGPVSEALQAAFGGAPDELRMGWSATDDTGETVFLLNSPTDDTQHGPRATLQIGYFSKPTLKGETND